MWLLPTVLFPAQIPSFYTEYQYLYADFSVFPYKWSYFFSDTLQWVRILEIFCIHPSGGEGVYIYLINSWAIHWLYPITYFWDIDPVLTYSKYILRGMFELLWNYIKLCTVNFIDMLYLNWRIYLILQCLLEKIYTHPSFCWTGVPNYLAL